MNYRKIYEQQYGQIPKDADGRTYEIHHIDGNRSNNSPENLKAVSIQEHYDIHKSQGDWAACLRIAAKMAVEHKEISELARKNALKRVENGTHPFLDVERTRKNNLLRVANGTHNFLGPKINDQKVANRTHPFLGGEIQKQTTQRRIADGTHNLLGERNPSHKRIANGTHNFLDNGFQQMVAQKRIENGTDYFSTNNPSKTKLKCPYCPKEGGAPQMKQWHFDNCKWK